MLLAKKIAGELIAPLWISIFAIAAGLALLWLTRRQRAGKLLASAAHEYIAIAWARLTGSL